MIATRWLVIADKRTVFDPACIELSALHSNAVDYPKSGVPVPMNRLPKADSVKPDWNAPETVAELDPETHYESSRAIGKLYRAIDLPAVDTIRREQRKLRRRLKEGERWTLEELLGEFCRDVEPDDSETYRALSGRVAGFVALDNDNEDMVAQIWDLFRDYASQLQTICADHTVSGQRNLMLTEEEAVVGTIVAKCSQPRWRRDLMSKMREKTTSLVNGTRSALVGEEEPLSVVSVERAWVAYRIALIQDDAFGARSFAWVALGALFDAIKAIEESEEDLPSTRAN